MSETYNFHKRNFLKGINLEIVQESKINNFQNSFQFCFIAYNSNIFIEEILFAKPILA